MAVVNINRNQFEEMVHSGNAVLVEFSAPWCVYCRRLAPALESVAEEYKDTLVFTAINIDDEPELAEAEAIEVVPTLLIYHSGQVLGSIVAPESRAQLVAFIEETLQHQTKEANTVQHVLCLFLRRLGAADAIADAAALTLQGGKLCLGLLNICLQVGCRRTGSKPASHWNKKRRDHTVTPFFCVLLYAAGTALATL